MKDLRFCSKYLFCVIICIFSSWNVRCEPAAMVKIYLDDFRVETVAFVENERRLYGIQPGNLIIEAVKNDSVTSPVFESVGCSCYEASQSFQSFEITVYSNISILYSTFCAIEDLEPIRPEWCDVKFHLIYDKSGLRGDVAIVNYENHLKELKKRMGRQYVPIPDMKQVLENIRGEYYYPYPEAFGLLVYGYLSKGLPTKEILNFMEAFKNALIDNGIVTDSQCGFEQTYSIYKFILEHEGKTLELHDLGKYASISYRLNEYYGNTYNH